MKKVIEEEILKCCNKIPEVFNSTFVSGYAISYLFQCTKCGHHIHSQEGFARSIPIWNRSPRKKI